jgi:hypothetical protein
VLAVHGLAGTLGNQSLLLFECPKPANHPEIVFGLGDGDLNHPLQALVHALEVVQRLRCESLKVICFS